MRKGKLRKQKGVWCSILNILEEWRNVDINCVIDI